MKYLSNIDLNRLQLIRARVENNGSFPTTPGIGQIFFHTTNELLYIYDGAGTEGGGGWSSLEGETNLAYTASATNGIVTSDTGTDATIPVVTPVAGTNLAGLMSPADKTKLDASSVDVTLNADTTTQETLNLVGQELQVNKATTSFDGAMSAEDKSKLDGITIANYQLLSEKDQISGYAGLDGAGKINPLQLPALAISETFVVATEAAQLLLTVQEGDVAVRTDQSKSYIALNATNATMADWQELLTPADSVQSVFGRQGTVTAQSGDYTADQITESGTKVFVTPTEKTAITHSNRTALDAVSGVNTGDEPDASLTVKGIIEIADGTEALAGTDAVRAITPSTLKTVVDASLTATKYAATFGDGASTIFTISAATHGLGTSGDFIVQVREVATGDFIITDIRTNASTGEVRLEFAVAPTSNELRVVIKS